MLVLYTQCVCIFITGTLLHHFFDVSLQARSWENIGERRLEIQEFDEGIVKHTLHQLSGWSGLKQKLCMGGRTSTRPACTSVRF